MRETPDARAIAETLRANGIYGVGVDVSGHHVRLQGVVASREELDRAVDLAGLSHGVSSVNGELQVRTQFRSPEWDQAEALRNQLDAE